MRGPMVARVVMQLLKGTEWGDLDVRAVGSCSGLETARCNRSHAPIRITNGRTTRQCVPTCTCIM
jgi:hypothetical protein